MGIQSPHGGPVHPIAALAEQAPDLLSPVDATWFRMESTKNPADVIALLMFDGEIDEGRLRATIEERLLPHRKFRRRVEESPLRVGLPHWEDEPGFSLDHHVFRRSLRAPGDEEDLAALLEELVNVPLDFDRSPWRVYIIDGGKSGSMLVAQLHHCMGDGFALLDLVLSLAEGQEHPQPRPASGPENDVDHGPLREAWRIARRLQHGVTDLGHLLLLPFDPATRLRGTPGGRRRVAWSRGSAFSSVRALARAHDATVNDVILAALTGALRRYLSDHGDPLEAFRAIVPVNLRPRSEPIDHEHGNWFGLVFADLPVGLSDRTARLAAVKRSMDRIKASEEPFVSLAVMNVIGRSPAVIEHVADELLARKATVVVTNVPGPRQTFTLAGRRVTDMLFWAPHPCGLSCGVSILSYAGALRVGVRSDVAVVPDPERIARYFDEEILTWEAAVQKLEPSRLDRHGSTVEVPSK